MTKKDVFVTLYVLKGRMEAEQVNKTIKQYMQSHDKDMSKLSEYSKQMGINKKVMEIVGGAYYE